MDDQATSTHDAGASREASPARESGRVGRNLANLGAGQLFTWTMTLAWTLVVPRLLGPGGVGLILTGMSVAGVLQIFFGAGTGVYVAREIVVSPARAARLVATATLARLLVAPVFLGAIVIWAALANYSTEGNVVLYLSGAATVLYLLAEPMQSFFQATERMHYMALGDAIYKAAQGLAGIVVTLLGFGALGFAGCWVVAAGIVLLMSAHWVRRYTRLEFRTTWREIREVARGSIVYWTAGVFYMIYLWIDTAMLSLMTNPTVVGWYGVPSRLFGTMLFVPTVFSAAWFPRLVQAFQGSRHELHKAARVPVELVLCLALPIAALIAAAASPVIHLVYGPAYANAVPVLIILGFALIPMYLNIMLAGVCYAANRQRHWTWLMVGATLGNPALNAFLIPLTQHRFGNGAIGAAIALAGTEAVIACAGYVIAGRQVLGFSSVRRVCLAGLASGGMWVVVHMLRSTGPIVSLAAGGAALIILAVTLGVITRDERRQLRVWATRAIRKVPVPRRGRREARINQHRIGGLGTDRSTVSPPEIDRAGAPAADGSPVAAGIPESGAV